MTNLDGVTDDLAPQEGDVAEDGPAEFGETGEAFEGDYEPEPEPQYDYLDIDDELASKYVRIKQDGEEIAVPLKEAIDGYNANSVATKRFQEASELKQQAEHALRIQQALETNPGMTVQILAQQAGVSVEEFLGMTPAQQQRAMDDNSGYSDEDEYMDPLERKIAQLEQTIQQQQQAQAQREADERLARSVNALKQQYQIDDDQVRAVVGKALELGVGPDMFPMIYESMAFQMQRQATAQQTAAQEAEAQRRRQAAQRASRVTGAGQSVSETSRGTAAPAITSPRDAVAAALSELGID